MQSAQTVQRLPFDSLFAQIPASTAEVHAMASQLCLVSDDIAYYYLSKAVYVKNAVLLFGTLLTCGMSLDRVVYTDLQTQLTSEMSEDLLQYLLMSLGSATSAGVWLLDATKVARAVALCVLHPSKVSLCYSVNKTI